MKWQALVEAFKKIETPFYLYDTEGLRNHVRSMKSFLPSHYKVHYALKANNNPCVTEIMLREGLGVDCVSYEEMQYALDMGFDPASIVLAGVGKSEKEITLAVRRQIFSINVESLQELEVIASIAREMNLPAPVALRINPNIDAATHHYITTGLEENKFGILWRDIPEAVRFIQQNPVLQWKGLHFHIGSQITELFPFERLCLKVNEALHYLSQKNIKIQFVNVGGGLGVDYHDPENTEVDFASYFQVFQKFLEVPPGFPVHFELGRSLVANFGYLVTKVLYIKKGINTQFAIVDAGMTDLIRPSLYQAFHKIQNITSGGPVEYYDVVGPVCESSDTFIRNYPLPRVRRGDYLVIYSVGAYGEVMSSNYNLRRKPKSYTIEQLKIMA